MPTISRNPSGSRTAETTSTPWLTTGTTGTTTGTTIGTTGDTTNNINVEFNAVCQNVIANINTGGAVAINGDAVAEIAQNSGSTVEQVNVCLNEIDLYNDGVVTVVEVTEVDLDGDGVVTIVELNEFGVVVGTASASASASASPAAVQYQYSVTTVLPETGGASLLAIGAGVLLIGGGLLARRIVR